jgi:hypothetical protein
MSARHDANELVWDTSLSACAVGGGERRGRSRVSSSPAMKINNKELPFVLAFAADKSARSLMRLELLRAHPRPVKFPRPADMGLKSRSRPGTVQRLINHKWVTAEPDFDGDSTR